MPRTRLSAALVVAMTFLASAPGRAEDVVAHELAAVVSISVLRATPSPATDQGPTMTSAAPSDTGSGKPAAAGGSRGTRIIGSGFIIDAGGTIVTNQHVIADARDILVMLHDNTLLRATVVAASKRADIALIKVTADGPLPVVRFGDSDAVKVADPVLAVGNPLGLGGSVTRGIVSALDRDISETPYDDFIQTDAAINHGNSGGPLFNAGGEVIGVNTVIVTPGATSGSIGLGFAIPSNDVRFVAAALQRPGGLRTGTLDFVVQQVTPEMADALDLKKAEGVIVGGTREGGAASRCGIVAGDIVLRYGGMVVTNVRALARAIARTPPGAKVDLLIWRNEEPLVVTATVEALPREAESASAAASPGPADPGWQLAPARAPRSDGQQPDEAGVVVTRVEPGGAADAAGIGTGDVVLRIQREKVDDAPDVARVIAAARREQRHYVMVLLRNRDGLRWLAVSIE